MSNIVLVGASNVGKSSIFNVLTNSKQAIISHIPGTTRDRIFGTFELNEHAYTICDTGGLGDSSLDFAEDLTSQTKIAIQAAEVIWFVVDGSLEEPTSVDLELGNMLRSLNKPIYVLINKIDLPSANQDGFYTLGYKDLYPVSTRTKSGFDALINDSLKHIEPHQDDHDISITIVGRPNVGKSTWLNMLSKQDRFITSDFSGTTRDSSDINIKHKNNVIKLIDTAGIGNKNKIQHSLDFYSYVRTMQSIHDADVVCLMLDATAGIVSQDKKLMNELIQIGKPFFILFNKSDLVDHDNYLKDLDGFLPQYILVDEVSAFSKTGKHTFFKNLYTLNKESELTFSTNQLNNMLMKTVLAHEPPMSNGRRTKLRYIHQIQQSPRVFKIHGKQTGKLPKSYIRYLENSFRKNLMLTHVPIRFFLKDDHNPYI